MRWKLLVIIVVVATMVGFGGWVVFTIGTSGTATNLARQKLWFSLSLLIPILIAIFSAIFIYRHTARRRKLQAILAAVLVIALILISYIIGSTLVPVRLGLGNTLEAPDPSLVPSR